MTPKILVMPGLVPGIHAFKLKIKTWMAGTRARHDEFRLSQMQSNMLR